MKDIEVKNNPLGINVYAVGEPNIDHMSMVVACAIGLAACDLGGGDDTHKHTYAMEWSYDETYHWHAANCEHTNEVSDKAEHTFTDNICSICGYISATEGLEFELSVDETYYTVTGIGKCNDNDLIIPSRYNNLPVTSIGNSAFEDCSLLTSITIPDSITSIGRGAFSGCSSLVSATMPAFAIEDIPQDNLKTVVITSGSISDYAFRDCISLTNITFTNRVTSIEIGAFFNCTALANVTFEENSVITSIDDDTFASCASLEVVTIPDSVTSIGSYAFSGCSLLKTVTFGKNSRLTSIGNSAFEDCSLLKSMTIL